jgi:hypothetical protein
VTQASEMLGLTSARRRQMVAEGVLREVGRAGETILLDRREVGDLLRNGWTGRRSATRIFSPKSGGFGPDVYPAHRPLRGGAYLITYAEKEQVVETLNNDLLSTLENLGAEDPEPTYQLHAARADDTASIAQVRAGFSNDSVVREFLRVTWGLRRSFKMKGCGA